MSRTARKTISIATLALLLTGTAQAQVFKCTDPATGEITFSQTKCAGQDVQNLSPPKTFSSTPSRASSIRSPELDFIEAWVSEVKSIGYAGTSSATKDESSKCLSDLKNKGQYYDPESIRIEGLPMTSVLKNGRKEVTLMVNAKNRYGGYVGARGMSCYYAANGTLEMVMGF